MLGVALAGKRVRMTGLEDFDFENQWRKPMRNFFGCQANGQSLDVLFLFSAVVRAHGAGLPEKLSRNDEMCDVTVRKRLPPNSTIVNERIANFI